VLTALVDEVQFFAGLEADRLAGSDGHFSAGSGIAPDAGLARLDSEDAESAKFNTITGDQGLLHALEDGVDCGFRLGSGQTGAFNNPLYEILFNHLGAILGCNFINLSN